MNRNQIVNKYLNKFDNHPLRMPAGYKDKIDKVLTSGESRNAFIVGAIDKEIKRREE